MPAEILVHLTPLQALLALHHVDADPDGWVLAPASMPGRAGIVPGRFEPGLAGHDQSAADAGSAA